MVKWTDNRPADGFSAKNYHKMRVFLVWETDTGLGPI